jgi:hypothetical protein
MTGDQIHVFLTNIKNHQDFYKSYQIDILSIKEGNQWFILLSIIKLFYTDKPKKYQEVFSIKDKISILHIVKKFDSTSFSNMIMKLGKGELSVNDKPIILDNFQDPTLHSMENENWQFVDLKDTEGWPAEILHCSGRSIRELVKDHRSITELINIHKPDAYSDLNQLAKKYIGLPLTPAHSSNVYVVASIYRKLEPLRLSKKGHLQGILKCHKYLKLSDFLLTVIYNSDRYEKIDDFHLLFKNPRKTERVFYEKQFKDGKDKVNVSNAIVSLAHSTDYVKVYRKELRCTEVQNMRLSKHFDIKCHQELQNQFQDHINIELTRNDFSESTKLSILRIQDHKCANCSNLLNVINYDHIDGNRSNNDKSNCQALCPNCHAIKTYTAQSKYGHLLED